MTLTVEDPMFLREPVACATRWLPAPDGYKLQAYACDAEDARRAVKYRTAVQFDRKPHTSPGGSRWGT